MTCKDGGGKMKILIDISEEKYKRIKYMYVHNNPTANEFKNTILNGEIIEKLPSVTPQALEQTRWIPVSERLPENSGRYLAYIVNEYDDKLQYIMTCEYIVNGRWNWWPDDECASDNVVAWMPLPELYKVESKVQE